MHTQCTIYVNAGSIQSFFKIVMYVPCYVHTYVIREFFKVTLKEIHLVLNLRHSYRERKPRRSYKASTFDVTRSEAAAIPRVNLIVHFEDVRQCRLSNEVNKFFHAISDNSDDMRWIMELVVSTSSIVGKLREFSIFHNILDCII